MCIAQDATFELMDALLLTRKAQSLADLSSWLRLSSPMVERLRSIARYSSRSTTVNEALHRTNPSIRTNCTRRRSHEESRGRLPKPFKNAPTNIPHRNWEVVRWRQGYGYSTLAWIPEAQGSWAVPLLHQRITSWDSPISQAVQQLSSVSAHLPSRALSLWDSEYGCAPFINQTAELPVDKLMRLRSNLSGLTHKRYI